MNAVKLFWSSNIRYTYTLFAKTIVASCLLEATKQTDLFGMLNLLKDITDNVRTNSR